MELSQEFSHEVKRLYGQIGEHWLARLPNAIDRCNERHEYSFSNKQHIRLPIP
ncbi:MAG: hypothetical protein K0Q59_758 [Paenibacillus sp.]|jgi:hypothetical protein|nr:hypothetical protein [Paenibacillus sp.]